MNYNSDNKKINFIINIVYILLVIFLAYGAARYALPLFLPFVAAFLLSLAAEPFILFLTKKLKVKRAAAAGISITLLIILLVCLVVLLSMTVMSGAKQLYNSIPRFIEQIRGYFDSLEAKSDNAIITPFEKLTLRAFDYIRSIDVIMLLSGKFGSAALNSFSGIMMSIPYMLMSLLVTLVSSVFISASFPEIKEFILLQFSDKNRSFIIAAKQSAACVFKKYVKSYAVLMLITFSELTLFFVIFDIKPAAAIALAISAVDILPVLGVGTVMLPWALISFLAGKTTFGLILLSIYAVITVVRQIIEPKIVGENIGLHPIVTLISIYIGLKLLGILGIFILPITIIILRDLQKKGFVSIWREK